MSKKKKLILDTAVDLFNKYGYDQVTIRMIALKLNISSGNLNYHYRNRKDIFEAIYFEMVSVFDERIETLDDTEISIAQIRNDIKQSMIRMIDYKFFWTDLYNLLDVSDKVKKHFQEAYKARVAGCFLLFKKMKNQHLMRGPSFASEYKFLTERMINYGNTWIYSSGLYLNQLSPQHIENQVNILLSMLYPFLTKKGQKEFENVLPALFHKD